MDRLLQIDWKKCFKTVLVFVVVSSVDLTDVFAVQNPDQSPAALLQKAVHREDALGDAPGAIKLYEQLLEVSVVEQQVAAQALPGCVGLQVPYHALP